MLAMRVLVLVCWLLALVVGVTAQTTPPCQSVSVENSDTVDRTDHPIVFTARVKNDAVTSERLQYKWQTSAGTIMTGQNTSSISVDIVGLAGQSLTATVEIIGLGDSCSIASGTVRVIAKPFICGLAFDQYGDLKWEYEKARLDNFAIQLLNQPSSRGALIAFAGNPTYKGEAAHRLNRAVNYLVNVRNVPRERLTTTDAGHRTDLVMIMYVVPEGATLPASDPYGVLPLSEVRFTKPKPNVRRRSNSQPPQ
jgi:hypothetical protein